IELTPPSRKKIRSDDKPMSKERIVVISCLALTLVLLGSLPLAAQDTVNHAIRFAVSAPMGEMAQMPQTPQYGFHEANPVRRVPKPHTAEGQAVDSVEQSTPGPEANYSVIANFLGVGNGFPGYSVPDAPPDTNMAVGDTQIVQWVNVSYTVCSKTAPYTCGPAIEGNVLWSNLGGACASNNSGDPIAQWDVQAHRWLLTQNIFGGNYGVCVAISTTSDANGTYYLYQFPVVKNGFPDYPKWGIWTNNYGETWNNFGTGSYVGPVFCAYNRTKLLAGDKSAEQICHQYSGSEDSLLPADLDSPTLPPSGEDQFAIGSVGDVDNSHLSLYSVHINNPSDWSQGATFTGDGNSQLIPITTFTPACNGAYGGACVPQKGVTDKADSLGDRLMYRFAYWNDGSSGNQHWLVNFDVTASSSQGGVRWMEITAPESAVPPTSLSVFQQGTFAPDATWRWMGSLARDKNGDILLGYSESCGSTCSGGTPTFPSIYVAGRTPSDAAGTLESELQLVAGAGSQPDTSNRWGDYSSMRIDQDGCTFWYTTEYYKTTASFDWSTQIGSFSFAGCTGGGGNPQVSLSATSLKWGKILVGSTSGAKKLTVTNTGTATLNLTNIATTGDFALVAVKQTKKVTPCVSGGTVAPGASCLVKVHFTPTQTGLRTGTLQFTDNAPDSPQSVALSGTGK
ncbi:MAG: choice-of-anchor D domain-containing protein, partial [Rhizomicrobium sp.]